MSIQHIAGRIIGYADGIIVSDEPPKIEYTDRGDLPKGNKANANSWFYLDGKRYNVHPYRVSFGGYPVRWIEDCGVLNHG